MNCHVSQTDLDGTARVRIYLKVPLWSVHLVQRVSDFYFGCAAPAAYNDLEQEMPDETREVCGIVMPISALDNCSEAHWAEVREILEDAIEEAGFEPNLVSNADDVGIIQKRIIQNLSIIRLLFAM